MRYTTGVRQHIFYYRDISSRTDPVSSRVSIVVLLKLVNVSRTIFYIQNHNSTRSSLVRIALLMTLICFISHWIGCFWYLVGLAGIDDNMSWITRDHLLNTTLFRKYARCGHELFVFPMFARTKRGLYFVTQICLFCYCHFYNHGVCNTCKSPSQNFYRPFV